MTKKVDVGWRCPKNEAGEGFGFNESGIEHFAGDPYSAIAREITQNTNDAVSEAPAFLQFNTIQVDKSDFPNHEEFRDLLKKCRHAAEEEGQKAVAFFDNALNIIDDEQITFLVARDRNTTGIAGPCRKGTPYHAFMKSSGTSKKPDIDSGGSFGIGKNAPFAISDLHTVFVVTRYQDDNGNIRQLSQGKSILLSHGEHGTEFTNNAYWGVKDDFSPVVDDEAVLPAWMTNPFNDDGPQEKTGTTIFIAGFRKNPNWDKIIAAYIIQNFFGAIQKKSLTAEVGSYSIDENSIEQLFLDEAIENAISDFPGQPDSFLYSRHYFRCMNSTDTIHETSQQTHLGKTNIGILLGEDLPRKVAFIRNGMLITDNLYRLQRFPGMKNFVAVVECTNSEGNRLLKRMEPPRHDDFQPERLLSESDKRQGRAALKQLADFVKKHLNQYARNAVEEEVNLDELRNLLGTDAVGADSAKDGEVNPVGELKLARRPKSAQNSNRQKERAKQGLGEGFEGAEMGGDLGKNNGGIEKGAQPSGEGDKNGVGIGGDVSVEGGAVQSRHGSEKNNIQPLALRNVRGIRLGSNSRRIFFMAVADAMIHLSFERVGAENNSPMKIDSVSIGRKLNENVIEMQVKKLEKIQVDVTFKHDFEGAVKVKANEI